MFRNKKILSTKPFLKKKLIYQMEDQTAIGCVIDYAKHKDDTYNVTIFELQNPSRSCLTNTRPDKHRIARTERRKYLFQYLIPNNTHFMDRYSKNSLAFPFNKMYQSLKKATYKLNLEDPEFRIACGVLDYHILHYNFSSDNSSYCTQYKPDYLIGTLNNKKTLQRLWLNSIPALQLFLPEKTMIVSKEDFKNLNKLSQRIMQIFGNEGDIFLKTDSGSQGKKNIHVVINNNEHMLQTALLSFKSMLKNNFGLVETTSLVGKSEEKKSISNYRAVCTLIKKQNIEQFRMVNIWRSLSSHSINSHEHEQTDYYAETVPLSVIHTTRKKIKWRRINSNKIDKHLHLETHKPELFHLFKILLTHLTTIDFQKMVNAASLWRKNKLNAGRVFYASAPTAKKMARKVHHLFKQKTNQQAALKESFNEVKEYATHLESARDWLYIAAVVLTILNNLNSKNRMTSFEDIKQLILEPSAEKAQNLADGLLEKYRASAVLYQSSMFSPKTINANEVKKEIIAVHNKKKVYKIK